MNNLRILHILSPVRWNDSGLFLHENDSNFKVFEKTVDFLPNCHHYVLVPRNHNIPAKNNCTFIRFDYPTSVHANRAIFDYRHIKFNFTQTDIDFVFNHQPELTFNIQQWLHTNRYFEDVAYIGFYHWIDCKASRGSKTGSPSFYMRQLEAFHIHDVSFVHSERTWRKYFFTNFDELDCPSILNQVNGIIEMPLSAEIPAHLQNPTPFDFSNLQDKRILVFNHRWNESSGIKKLQEYIKDLPDNYLIWITDDRCDIQGHNIMVKRLNQNDYHYLISQCYGTLCFIDGYTTWNLSIQDSILRNKPCFCFKNDSLTEVLGDDYPYYFDDKNKFRFVLEQVTDLEATKKQVKNWDNVFKKNLLDAMQMLWQPTKTTPKEAPAWLEQINNGVIDKKQIANNVNDKVRLSGSYHFIRRWLLHNGVQDNTAEPYTTYFIEGNAKTIKQDLFSNA